MTEVYTTISVPGLKAPPRSTSYSCCMHISSQKFSNEECLWAYAKKHASERAWEWPWAPTQHNSEAATLLHFWDLACTRYEGFSAILPDLAQRQCRRDISELPNTGRVWHSWELNPVLQSYSTNTLTITPTFLSYSFTKIFKEKIQ